MNRIYFTFTGYWLQRRQQFFTERIVSCTSIRMIQPRFLLVLAIVCSVRANFDMDPVRDPVLRRLDIPAQIPSDHQDFHVRDKHLPDVFVEAGQPFVINLPFKASNNEVILIKCSDQILVEAKERV